MLCATLKPAIDGIDTKGINIIRPYEAVRPRVKAEQKQLEKEKKQLLRVMKKNPDHFKTQWTESLGWVNSKGNVDQTRIKQRLKQLESDGLVLQIGHRYLVR